MIALKYLIELNNRQPRITRDNFNRDCSALKTRTTVDLFTGEKSPCFVCHSAAQRSTFTVTDKEHPESYALLWWVVDSKSQAGLNAAIESLQLNQTVPHAWRAALLAIHGPRIKGLKINGGDKFKALRVPIVAEIPSGMAVLHLGAVSFAELHCKLGKIGGAA